MGGFEDLNDVDQSRAVAFVAACETFPVRARFYDPLLRRCGIEDPAFERRQRRIQRAVEDAGQLAVVATGESDK